MTTRYAILYGSKGVKDFRKKSNALKFGIKKSNILRKMVYLDKITTYPKARVGMTDFTQRTVKIIKPKRRK